MSVLDERIRIVKFMDVENPHRFVDSNDPKVYFQIASRTKDIDRFNELNDFSLGLSIRPPKNCFVQLFPTVSLIQAGYDMIQQTIHSNPTQEPEEVIIKLIKVKDKEDLPLPFYNGVYALVFKDFNNDIHIEKIDGSFDKDHKISDKIPIQKVRYAETTDYFF